MVYSLDCREGHMEKNSLCPALCQGQKNITIQILQHVNDQSAIRVQKMNDSLYGYILRFLDNDLPRNLLFKQSGWGTHRNWNNFELLVVPDTLPYVACHPSGVLKGNYHAIKDQGLSIF